MYSEILNPRYRIAQFSILGLIFLSFYSYHYIITDNGIHQMIMRTATNHELSDGHLVHSILNTSGGIQETFWAMNRSLEQRNYQGLSEDTSERSKRLSFRGSLDSRLSASTNILNGGGKLVVDEKLPESQNMTMNTTTVRVPAEGSIAAIYQTGHSVSIPEKCPNSGAGLKLLILITSAPSHTESRKAIRLTWGHFGQRKDVRIAFFLGNITTDSKVEEALLNERETYDDIIRGNFVDAYSNLTLKSISALEWVSDYCSKVEFVLKTDDDMFINVPLLLEFIEKHSESRNVIFGRLAVKWKPDRNKLSKYYISEEEFGMEIFPQFTTGPAYLLSSDVIPKLYEKSLEQSFMRLEDVFITGIVAQELGIERRKAVEFVNERVKLTPCKIQHSISIHMVEYSEQFDLWAKLLDGRAKCP